MNTVGQQLQYSGAAGPTDRKDSYLQLNFVLLAVAIVLRTDTEKNTLRMVNSNKNLPELGFFLGGSLLRLHPTSYLLKCLGLHRSCERINKQAAHETHPTAGLLPGYPWRTGSLCCSLTANEHILFSGSLALIFGSLLSVADF